VKVIPIITIVSVCIIPIFVEAVDAVTFKPDVLPLGTDQRTSPALVPWPKQVQTVHGSLTLTSQTRITYRDSALSRIAEILADELAKTVGIKLKTVKGPALTGDIALVIDKNLKHEAYTLTVGKDVVLAGHSYGAVAMGTVTLLQAAVKTKNGATLPAMTITDAPDRPYRGLMIDLARQYHDIASLKQITDLCRMYKINYLQIHISDDQGFMFPTPSFPKAWAKENQQNGAPRAYTMEELKEWVAYADERYVTIIPEFDIPGHSAALNRSDRDFWMIRGTKPYEHHASINFAKDEVIEACRIIITEMCGVFKSSPYFHIGGDEADYAFAMQNDYFKKALEKEGVKHPHELYLRFLCLMNETVKKNGKKTIVWEGFHRGDSKSKFAISKDVIVMEYENRFYQADELVADGYTVINASWTPLYTLRLLDNYAPKIYEWNLFLFGAYTKDYSKTTWRQIAPTDLVIGAQLCPWEQKQPGEVNNVRWSLPALSERIWNMDAGRSWENFKTRLVETDAKAEPLLHMVHFDAGKLANPEDRKFENSMTLQMSSHEPGIIRYTLNGALPDAKADAYAQPLTIEQKTTVRAALFDATGKQLGPATEDVFEPLVPTQAKKAAVAKPVATKQPPTVNEPRKTIEVKGACTSPNKEHGRNVNYKLVGDMITGWQTGELAGDIDLNGFSLRMETGGGNSTAFLGVISGKGNFTWVGGGVPQAGPSILKGDAPNTFQCAFTLAKGILDLDKPEGKDAIPGNLIIGTQESAIITLKQNEQINDSSHVTIGPEGVSGFRLNGKKETIATLTLKGHAVIDYSEGPSVLAIGDSSSCDWNLAKVITIRNFKKSDQLRIGNNNKGLTTQQLARIGFENPEAKPKGLYTSKMDNTGLITPDARAVAINPPFDVSDSAFAEREKKYTAFDGSLEKLTGKDTPVKKNLNILFFGDSLTWQDSFVGRIRKGFKDGEGTKDKTIAVINRGINGGGVLQVRDGSKEAAFPGSSAQKPFAELLASDKADVAVVLIGVNDVWWRKTTPEDFEAALRNIAQAAKAAKVRLVISTLTIQGEVPDNKNPNDAKLDQYAGLTETVAKEFGVPFVNARDVYKAYLLNNNAELRVDGSLYIKTTGILTYDGVHPNGNGVNLLTQLISDGLLRVLKGE
jgi:N-acetyl-beta-hexosaminidase/lysophospholipase L1-like esterase